ncbi:MAG: AraC family transcriptional regulator [Cyanobacteria bacterium P01_H01_bin.21]
MTITLSRRDYWDLVDASQLEADTTSVNAYETVLPYPNQLGKGHCRHIELREGIDVSIKNYQLHSDVVIPMPEREHSVEYEFCISGQHRQPNGLVAGRHVLCGSGTAPVEIWERSAKEPFLKINVHIEPSLLQTFLGESFDLTTARLAHLIRPTEQLYFQRYSVTSITMQTVLHQFLHCPFEGITRKVYFESKVWELMALLIDQELQQKDANHKPNQLNVRNIECIYHARDILIAHLDNPPSLLGLARQVGLNDYALKQGFRQVFGDTAFGYLHNYRMERARQLLIEGEVNVSEAASRVGFANRSYFANAFRKKFGVFPSKYRRQRKNSG